MSLRSDLQIPKEVKVVEEEIEVTQGKTMTLKAIYCPNCNKRIRASKVTSCNECGQKIKWSKDR